jgi:hypothetical protein
MMLSPKPAFSFLFLLDWEDGTLSDLRDGGQSRGRIPSGRAEITTIEREIAKVA